MTNKTLAELDRAEWAGKLPLLLECVENGVWQIRLIFGEGEKNCTAMRQWADLYRTGKLVLIDDGAVEAMRVGAEELDAAAPLLGESAAGDMHRAAAQLRAALSALGVK